MVEALWAGGPRSHSGGVRILRALVPFALVLAFGGVVGATGAHPTTLAGHRSGITPADSIPPPATENPSWSGELAWASKNGAAAFDNVTGAWVQPAVMASPSAEYADTWVGVDGYDGKLLQAGTTAWTQDDSVSYDAWFVAWNGTPSGMTVIDKPVAAGDHMEVAIDHLPTGMWTVTFDDQTAGWQWSTTVTYPANGSTAEWVEEAPGTWSTSSRYQTLADYSSVAFTTVRADGTTPAIVTAFDVEQNGDVVSYPSTYDPAQASFAVQYGEPVPTVHSLSPSSGPSAGGTTVDLSGENFGTAPVVRFGGAEATVVASSTTAIVVRTPSHVPGAAAVTVTATSSGPGPSVSTSPARFQYASEPGYAVVSASGGLKSFGSARPGDPRNGAGVVGVAKDAATGGYWEATSGGGVYDVNAPDLGTLTALVDRLSIGTVAGIAATPTGSGYWLVTSQGDVYDFGTAASLGTLRNTHLAARIVGIEAAPTGTGYWLVAADGGVFAFGTASYTGSAAELHLHSAVVGMSATVTGRGYWLVAGDGGVFAFGQARFLGSAAGMRLAASIVGIAASTTGHGYWLVAADGGVFAFGSARFCGSAATSSRTSPSVGIVST